MSKTYRTVCRCGKMMSWTVTPRVKPGEVHDLLISLFEDGGYSAEIGLADWLERRFGIELELKK